MTDERMALLELVEKSADADLVCEMLAFAAERIMDAEAELLTGASKGARTALRETHRNGYRDRDWDTRAGLPVSPPPAPSPTSGAAPGSPVSIGTESCPPIGAEV